jgi:hypothetical protein
VGVAVGVGMGVGVAVAVGGGVGVGGIGVVQPARRIVISISASRRTQNLPFHSNA